MKPAKKTKKRPAKQNYIFGYGSLMEDESRERTTPSARYAWPCVARGVRRGWWARGSSSGLTTTYLGALRDPKKRCNGVIYPVSEEELAATDERESAGYKRLPIKPADIRMLDGRSAAPDGAFWAYINTFPPSRIADNAPTAQFPMVQSYVDLCVNGCLEIEGKYRAAEGFADLFVRTTESWSRYWVNDRVYPRRPFIYQPAASAIDGVLRDARPTRGLVWEVEIEPASWEDRKPVPPEGQEPAPPGSPIAIWSRGG